MVSQFAWLQRAVKPQGRVAAFFRGLTAQLWPKR